MRHVEAAQRAQPRPQGDWTPGRARLEGREVIEVVRRLRDDGPRLCELGLLQAPDRPPRREARPPLLRLGQDRAGEGQVRLLVVRPARARDGGDGREALDMPRLRQPRLWQRLPPRHEGETGNGQPGVVRRVDQVLRRVRGALQGRGGRVGDLERAVRAGTRIRGDVLPHREGDPRRPAQRETVLHSRHVPEGLQVRPGEAEEGERARPRLVLHLPSVRSESRHDLREARAGAAQAREVVQRIVRNHAGRGGVSVAAGVRPRAQ